MAQRYRSFNTEMKRVFGQRIDRVTVNAGLTCPNIDGTRAKGGCTFCQDASYLGKSFARGHSIGEQLENGIEYIKKIKPSARFFAYFQNGTNTYAPIDHLERLYNEALSFPDIVGLFIATRPDCLGPNVLDLLETLNQRTYLWVELGVQSHRNDILEQINRAHTVEEFENAVYQLNKRNINIGVHAILGLPGEKKEDSIEMAHYLNQLPIHGIKIHNLVIFKKTVMEKKYQEGKIQPISLKEYAIRCTHMIENLNPNFIIQRLNAHGPRSITVAPDWSVNKMGTMNAIHAELERRNSWQGKKLGAQLEF